MGASWFQTSARGKSLSDAYNDLREESEVVYGHQEGYNGTISTTIGCTDLTENFKRSGKSMAEYIEMQVDKLNKRDCAAICVEKPVANNNKTKSQVEHIVTPGTKKWILKYEVEELYGDGKVLASCTQKGDAVKMARAYTEKTGNTTVIAIRKLLTTPNIAAKISYKKSSTEKLGRWVFFGWAAE